jgi:folate-dependent phosphoribosylglycinamide formyltransferase PurN
MRVVILTQEDGFFIPKNIDKVANICEVLEVVNIDGKGSLNNKLSDFIKWFGVPQVLKMGLLVYSRKIKDIIDGLVGYKLLKGLGSVRSVAKKNKIPYQSVKNINDINFINHIKNINPDLIISFSAPQVIKEPLLTLPKYGIINVHGSLLPDYRGCMPSFWYLHNDEKWGGATVHYMSEAIDDGSIILQDKISLEGCKTMFEIMNVTKKLGGELMVRAILSIENQTVQVKPNLTSEGRYFTWPSIKESKEFLKNGKRLV